MIEAMVEGLALLSPTVLLWILIAVVLTTGIAIIPGLGGLFALVLMLPLILALPVEAGLAMLVGSMAVAGTGNTITGVLFGVPGSSDGVATILDGYPMAQKGEATRAVAAGLGASAVGGIFGAVSLAALLPLLRPVMMALSSPEFFMLICASLVFMATVTQGSTVKALTAGVLGLMIAFVGLEPSTSTQRYTFGILYLWSGVQLIPAVVGLFAISEMLDMMTKGGSIARTASVGSAFHQIKTGLGDVVRHWRVTLQSSVVGVVVGLIPGLGAVAAQFVAYTQASKTSRRGALYGTGIPEGVIAADAATNSKDGGSFVPTLIFGIPGSSVMAIFLAAMIALGIQPGQAMLSEHLPLIWMFIWILILANLLAVVFCLGFTGWLAKLTHVDIFLLAPPVLVLGLFGAYAATRALGDIWTAVIFGLVGLAMKRFEYSRANLVIGLVLGGLLERHYLLSMRMFGPEFVFRPITLGLLVLTVLVLLVPLARRARGKDTGPRNPATGEEEARQASGAEPGDDTDDAERME